MINDRFSIQKAGGKKKTDEYNSDLRMLSSPLSVPHSPLGETHPKPAEKYSSLSKAIQQKLSVDNLLTWGENKMYKQAVN